MEMEERAAATEGGEAGRRGNKVKREKTEIDKGERQRDAICVRDYVFWDWIII